MGNENSIARLYYVLPSSQICVTTVTEQSSYGAILIRCVDVHELEKEERKGEGKPA